MEIKKYSKEGVTVLWDSSKCVHSGVCVRGLSKVFNTKASPWINMEGASTQEIADQVKKCPSHALSIGE